MTTYPHIAATTTETRKARMTTDHGSELLGVALAAAARGWHVFPLRPGTKQPALHGYDRCPRTGDCVQKHQGWEQRATTDPARIQTAWGRRAYNVGIACGPSGLVVIDLDTSKPGEHPPQPWAGMVGVGDGQDVFTVLAEQATGDPLPAATYTVATPSGGLHLYYSPPAGVALRNTEGDRGRGLGWKVDTRAHGGYVVAAGSVVAGRTYRVLDDRDPIPLPVWLAERLAPAPLPAAPTALTRSGRSRYLDAAIHGETIKVLDAPDGQRNASLYAASVALGQLVAGGALSHDEATAALLSAAGKHVAVGAYSACQAAQTIASGIRAGANRPRQVA